MKLKRILAVFGMWLLAGDPRAYPQLLQWTRQFGEPHLDRALAVSSDASGHIYVAGINGREVSGTSEDYGDAFLSKFDSSGVMLWNRQFGTPQQDSATGISADNVGNVFVVGQTRGNLGAPNPGFNDAYLSNYDTSGNLLWTRQYGTSSWDESCCVAADGLGSVYVAGYTSGSLFGANVGHADLFISKYDSLGNLLWSRQLGTTGVDYSDSLSIDGWGNVYLSGTTGGNLGAPNAGHSDAFVLKFDDAGNLLWSRQVGTSNYENTTTVTADALGNVFVSGSAYESLGGPLIGLEDAYLLKYDSSGSLIWTRQFGTSHQTNSRDIIADGMGNVYVVGDTDGSLSEPNAGRFDVYLRKYDGSGDVLWTRQMGTSDLDLIFGVTADELGSVYIAGSTNRVLGAESAGGADAFLAKFTDNLVPEPSTWLIVLVAGSHWLHQCIRWRRPTAQRCSISVCALVRVRERGRSKADGSH
jgi:hypothetical protein